MTTSIPEEQDPSPSASSDHRPPEDKAALAPAVKEILKLEPGGSMEAELTVADADIRTDNEDKKRAR